jgi:VWFA-related protein
MMARLHSSRNCLRVFAICLVVACADVVAANSQTAPANGNEQDTGISTPGSLDLKPLPDPIVSASREGMFPQDVEVTDTAGNAVTNLDAKDFTLLDNGRPTRIFTFTNSGSAVAESDLPPVLILVFDEVDLPAQQLSYARKTAAAFLRENGGVLAQRVFLYRITSNGLFSSANASIDGNFLAEEVEKKSEPRVILTAEYARLRDGFSLRALGSISIDQREVRGRKVVVWFGNGWPVNAGGTLGFDEVTELFTRLREARITLDIASVWPDTNRRFDYHAYLAMPQSARDLQPGKLAPQVIAAHTGGLILDSSNDLKRDIERCAGQARAFYTLSFDPVHTNRADEFHELKVVVSAPGLTAHTANGYYDQPVFFDHPRPGVERVTVAQLQTAVQQSGAESDFARRLANMELTERLTAEKRDDLLTLLRKEKDRQALTALADVSAFLPPPAADIPADPMPDQAVQMEIVKRTFDYLANAIPKLPDFFATRTSMMFAEPKAPDDQSWKVPLADQTLHAAFTARGTVLYRNGAEEVVDEESNRKRGPGSAHALDARTSGPMLRERPGREHALDTRGTFGPVLASVLQAAANGQSTLNWSRWERSKNGNLAVFRFVVPPTTPIFEVTFCCLPQGDGTTVYRIMTGYHGEFAVDLSSGAILRLAIEADLDEDRDPEAPIIRSALMVEYGRVEIAGSPYICPLRSVSLSRGRTLRELHEWGMNFIVYAPFETMLNDFTFGEYHKFGSESRMLTGFDEIRDTNPPKSGASQPTAKPQ